jgi:hypothetical protein
VKGAGSLRRATIFQVIAIQSLKCIIAELRDDRGANGIGLALGGASPESNQYACKKGLSPPLTNAGAGSTGRKDKETVHEEAQSDPGHPAYPDLYQLRPGQGRLVPQQANWRSRRGTAS